MIRYRQTTKNCDICNCVVAVRKFITFDTVYEYVTIRRDEFSQLHGTERNDYHFCRWCWSEMEELVKKRLIEKGKGD